MPSDARWAAAALLTLLAGCASILYQPGPGDARAGTTLEMLQEGRELYAARCGTCHALVLPERLTPEEWREKLETLQPRARIDDSQKEAIRRYLLRGVERAAAGR